MMTKLMNIGQAVPLVCVSLTLKWKFGKLVSLGEAIFDRYRLQARCSMSSVATV